MMKSREQESKVLATIREKRHLTPDGPLEKKIKAESIELPAPMRSMDSISTSGGVDEQEEPEDPDDSVEKLPDHLQKLVDEFCSQYSLYAKNGPCCQMLRSSGVEENDSGKSIIFVQGSTGERLEARRCLVRKNNFALVVDGHSLSQSSIIRS